MTGLSATELLVVLGMILLLWNPRRTAKLLTEAISNFRNGGRGSGSPPQPLPSNDSPVLNRKRPKADS